MFFSKGGTWEASGGMIIFDTGSGGSDKIRYILGDSDGNNIATEEGGSINDGQFHHIAIAVVAEDGEYKLSTLYVNGEEDFTRSLTGLGSIDPIGPLFLGGAIDKLGTWLGTCRANWTR